VIELQNPPHLGSFVKTEILDARDLDVTSAAKALGVRRQTLSELLNGRAGLSADMAIRIEKAFGVRMDTLLRMQAAYDIALPRRSVA